MAPVALSRPWPTQPSPERGRPPARPQGRPSGPPRSPPARAPQPDRAKVRRIVRRSPDQPSDFSRNSLVVRALPLPFHASPAVLGHSVGILPPLGPPGHPWPRRTVFCAASCRGFCRFARGLVDHPLEVRTWVHGRLGGRRHHVGRPRHRLLEDVGQDYPRLRVNRQRRLPRAPPPRPRRAYESVG
jgi:hypothetical protein